MDSISVVLATYNGERFLAEQLDSLANQTNLPCELLVFDDASSDGTVAIVQRFARDAPFPVHLFENQIRIGYRRNFMTATPACAGDLIAFCDQDDIWKTDKLEIMGKVFSDPNVLLAYHDTTLIDDTGNSICRMFRRSNARQRMAPLTLYPWTVIPGHVQVVRQRLVAFTEFHTASVDPYCTSEVMPHDQWYPFWASVLGHIVYIPESLTFYRQHDRNASGWPYSNWIQFAVDHVKNASALATGEALGVTNRLALLQAAAIHVATSGDDVIRIETAIEYYRKFRAFSQNRSAIYNNQRLAERIRAFVGVLKNGGYASRHTYAGRLDTLALDTFIGIPFRGLGRHTHPDTSSMGSSASPRERPMHIEEGPFPELPSIDSNAHSMGSP